MAISPTKPLDAPRVCETACEPEPVSAPQTVIAAAPIAENGTANGLVICRRCQTPNTVGADECRQCNSYLKRNQKRRKTGHRARHHPDDVLMTADDLLAGVISDKGGIDEMSTLQRSMAAKLRDTDVLLALNKRTLIAEGVDTPTGRKAHDRYLSALDRFLRIAALLGLEREARRITPHEYWQQRQQQEPQP